MPLVINSLDYNNFSLHGLTASAVSRLLISEKHAALLLTRTGYRNNIIPVLINLPLNLQRADFS